ncbi:MDR family MFS transporter [Aestuariimicrobium sp. T2.26MG-19.2B]|uniref:MDR family MFS transporter n=1 Tax=Aestuariimicrobium sp. T2.26MG-19.2B TaxID=3040679 RepID=UPI002477B75B|nr:MDR family MFS transporter [Aestuariimicrobium sp. T2.26MG-19.2B]CAI9405885.1 Putative multidrug resistance protein MdtD [Aestuariimicrobium sp. T2.26MG-19.2B]
MTSHATAESAPASAQADAGLTHAQIVTILIGLMTGMFLAALDQTIVATAIRTIADDLDGLSQQAWATTAYLITSTIVTPLYGKLSDIYGRKRFFLSAITIFVFGSALCSLAGSMYQLAVFRAVQGLGAGGLFSLALAILGDIVPPRERARYQGFFLAVFGTSSVLGPVVGGFLAGQSSILGVSGWRWVFLVNVPLGLIAFIVVARTLHLRHRRLDHRIDWWGAAALSVAAVPLLLVAEQGRRWGWGSLDSILCYAVGLVGIVSFALIERRMGDEALLPFHLFRNRTIGISSIISVVIGIGMFGGLAMLPLYLQIVRGASPTKAGLLMLPLTLGIMTGSVLAGQLISKFGRYRRFIRMGGLLLTVGLVLFSFLRYDTAMWKVMLPMIVFGLGLGFMMQPLMLAVQNSADRKDMGVATSSATFTRQIGGTLGTAVFLSILFSVVPTKLAEAFTRWVPTAEFQAAVKDPQVMQNPVNQAFVKALQSGDRGGLNPLSDSSFIQHLDPRLARPFLEGFSNSMNLVFLVGACVMFVGWLVTFLLPHVELQGGERPAAE